MNRYDILLGKKYSEPKDQKEKFPFGGLQQANYTGSGVTTGSCPSGELTANGNIMQQRGIACTIIIDKKEYQGRFLDYSVAQDDNQTKTFNLTLELPGVVDTNIFFGNIIEINYLLNGVSALISCYSQAISSSLNVHNGTTYISMSGAKAVNEVQEEE